MNKGGKGEFRGRGRENGKGAGVDVRAGHLIEIADGMELVTRPPRWVRTGFANDGLCCVGVGVIL